MSTKVKDVIEDRIADMASGAEDALQESLRDGGLRLEKAIRERIAGMVSKVNHTLDEKATNFVGVNEDEILTYIADRRNFSGVGAFLIGLLILVIMPGWGKSFAMIAFGMAIIQGFFGYVWQSKVDIPEGYEGLVCQFGKPLPEKAHRGRNWMFSINRFIPYMVSNRDQVVEAFNANFTGDYVTVGLGEQIVFRVRDNGKFVSNTTPSGAMKLLSLYASYISLRMITSIGDARVKFTGRDHLDNVITALNGYLSEWCGIEVIRANMPQAENSVLEDLEKIRTSLKSIGALEQTRTVKLEAAIKTVEQAIRQQRVESRNEALTLKQTAIRLETYLSEVVNQKRQELLMSARQQLDQKVSELLSAIAELQANVEKSQALKASLSGLKSSWGLRLAQLRQTAMLKLMPKRVQVIGLEGVGTGVGLASGAGLMKAILDQSKIE